MGKRSSDVGHLSKEQYDALEDNEGGDDGDNAGQRRASNEVLQRRRIVRVSSKWKKGTGIRTPSTPMPAAPTPAKTPTNSATAAAPKPASNPNPFANASFASKGSTPKPSTPTTVNPFASVRFAATPANKTIGFGESVPIATSTKKMRPPIASTPSHVSIAKPFTPLRQGAKEHEKIDMDDSTKRNLEMLKVVQKEAISNPLADYTPLLKAYIQKCSKNNGNGASLTGTSNGAKNVPTPAVSVPKTAFSFSLAPATATAKESSSEKVSKDASSSPSKPKFSFASAPAAPAEAKTFTGFSFGNATAANSASSPVPAAVEKETEGSTGNAHEGATPGVIAGQLAADETELHSCRAKYLRRVASEADPNVMEWKSYAAGVLRLYKNNDDGKCKIVLRDAAGKVRLNLNIAKGTNFIKLDAKKGARSVQFLSIMDAKVGIEQFILKTRVELFDNLVVALESMA